MRWVLWDLISVGTVLAGLERVTARNRILSTDPIQPGVLVQVRDLIDAIQQLELARSDQTARDRLDPLVKRMEESTKDDPRARLGPLAAELREIAGDLHTVIRDEALERSAFVVPYDSQGYAEALVRDPRVLFRVNPAHPSAPPQHALQDLQEAAECYAIGRPAAAIVFSLRATEAFLRQFYCEVIRAQPDGQATWGTLLRTIQLPVVECSHSVPSELGTLQKRRNNAMHAGVRDPAEWNDQAAREVMEQCGRAIKVMWDHLTERCERGKRTPPRMQQEQFFQP